MTMTSDAEAGVSEAVTDEQLLYQPAPQLEGSGNMKTSWVMVSPQQAQEWLDKAEADTTFRQRPTKSRAVTRWLILMRTDRFVSYLPNGPLCFDENGTLINGKHRLTALTRQPNSFGFLVVEEVPKFMFAFFDTGLPRSLNDVFHIGAHQVKGQLGAGLKLGMRYEEFLSGKRKSLGWKDWPRQRDEHSDVETFLSRRTDLADWYYVGDQIRRGCQLLTSSGMVFRFYQSLAWPEGEERIIEFCEGLAKGSMLASGSPVLLLREWGRDGQGSIVRMSGGRRELHLLLMLRHFEAFVKGDKMRKLMWAAGFHMPLPYHPKGPDVARENVLRALAEIDLEFLKEQQKPV